MNVAADNTVRLFEVFLTCWKEGFHNVMVEVAASNPKAAENQALDTAYPGSEVPFRKLNVRVRQVRCKGILDYPIVIRLEVN